MIGLDHYFSSNFWILIFQPRFSSPDMQISPLGKIVYVESVFEIETLQVLHHIDNIQGKTHVIWEAFGTCLGGLVDIFGTFLGAM